ncbi:MAG: RsmB/NOP family class I SAM-dependent RNA methyltransferase, partial [Methylophilaceae bacterium]
MNRFLLEKTKEVLTEYSSSTRPADSIISYFFRNNKNLGLNERSQVAESYFGVIRNQLLYQTILDSDDVEKFILCDLSMSGEMTDDDIQKLNPDFALTQEDLKQQKNKIKELWIKYSLPQWIFDELKKTYESSQLEKVLESLASPSYIDLRINLMKEKNRDVIMSNLKSNLNLNEKKIQSTPFSPIGIRLPRGTQIQDLKIFKDGLIEVQDEGSQLLSYLVDANRNHMVADFCAGAGGKTLGIAALMSGSGRLYAFDVSDKRLMNLKKRFKRSGLSNVVSHLIKNENDIRIKRLKGKFDRVLVDSPCSGLGTIRRNPDLKWKHDLSTLTELQEKQFNILQSASRLCKLNGRVIYATCSFMPQENEDIVNRFLLDNNNFKI